MIMIYHGMILKSITAKDVEKMMTYRTSQDVKAMTEYSSKPLNLMWNRPI